MPGGRSGRHRTDSDDGARGDVNRRDPVRAQGDEVGPDVAVQLVGVLDAGQIEGDVPGKHSSSASCMRRFIVFLGSTKI